MPLAFLVAAGVLMLFARPPDLLTPWNFLPLVMAYWMLRDLLAAAGGEWRRVSSFELAGTLGAALCAIGLSGYVHLAWAMDLGGFRSEHPGAGIVFGWLPLACVSVSLPGYLAGWLLARGLWSRLAA